MSSRFVACTIAIAAALSIPGFAEAQRYPLAPRVVGGDHIHPFFEGWYEMEDGSKVFSFGYFNRNLDPDPVQIPRGDLNYIEPAQFDGMQPDWFPIRRERGVFVVVAPPDWPVDQEVVWTFESQGEFYSVPASWRTDAMQLTTGPAAMGSNRPYLRMDPNGEEGYGIIEPVRGEPRTARVNEPMELTIWARDHKALDAAREEEVAVQVTVWTHQGPALANVVGHPPPEAEDESAPVPGRREDVVLPNSVSIPVDSADDAANFTVTFAEPGDYLLRVMVDNHRAVDSSQGNQCCWTNGYLEVSVRP